MDLLLVFFRVLLTSSDMTAIFCAIVNERLVHIEQCITDCHALTSGMNGLHLHGQTLWK